MRITNAAGPKHAMQQMHMKRNAAQITTTTTNKAIAISDNPIDAAGNSGGMASLCECHRMGHDARVGVVYSYNRSRESRVD